MAQRRNAVGVAVLMSRLPGRARESEGGDVGVGVADRRERLEERAQAVPAGDAAV